jgi:sulfate permease, SulP family
MSCCSSRSRDDATGRQDLLDDLQAFGLAPKIGAQRIFPTLATAVAAYQEWAKPHPQPGPGVAA